ncbi:ribonuclease H-like domain-containing protein [Tanacetum coccineum]
MLVWGKLIQKLRKKRVYEESFSRHDAWIGGKPEELRRHLQHWKRFEDVILMYLYLLGTLYARTRNDIIGKLGMVLPHAFSVTTPHDLASGAWNMDTDGTLSRYKARLVANGSIQLEGVDVDGIFSQVVKPGHRVDTAYLLLYVDDIMLTTSSLALLQQIITSLQQEFSMTYLGSFNYFLGISVTRDSSRLFLSQKKYVVEILERAHMVNCNPNQTPVDTKSKLGIDGDLVLDPTIYRSLAGSLQYLTFTHPDISYAVQQVCLYMHDPQEPHFLALKRILRYVRDWDGWPSTRRSTSGYYVCLGNNLLSWSSKRQPKLSRSSAEAKYRGVANTVAVTYWLRNLLRELHTPLSSATLVYYDNVSAVYLSCNPVQHQCTKHIEIDIHFVRDLVAAGQVRVLHVPSSYQYANIFTKGLPSALFEEFRSSLSVRCSPISTAEEC